MAELGVLLAVLVIIGLTQGEGSGDVKMLNNIVRSQNAALRNLDVIAPLVVYSLLSGFG